MLIYQYTGQNISHLWLPPKQKAISNEIKLEACIHIHHVISIIRHVIKICYKENCIYLYLLFCDISCIRILNKRNMSSLICKLRCLYYCTSWMLIIIVTVRFGWVFIKHQPSVGVHVLVMSYNVLQYSGTSVISSNILTSEQPTSHPIKTMFLLNCRSTVFNREWNNHGNMTGKMKAFWCATNNMHIWIWDKCQEFAG